MQPVQLLDMGGGIYRAFTYDAIPSNQAYVDWIFYPNWSSASFLPQDVSWTKTGGSDALFTLNPANHGYTVPAGGMVIRCQRNAVGGAGTSAMIQGLTSGGLGFTLGVNMAQPFTVATGTPAELPALIGGVYLFSASCNYGSGTTRSAELWRKFDDGTRELIYTASGPTSGAPQTYNVSTSVTADRTATYWWQLTDSFSRTLQTAVTRMTVATGIKTSRITLPDGTELTPGGNMVIKSSRFTTHETKIYPLVIVSDPPMPALGFAAGYERPVWDVSAPGLIATKATVAQGLLPSDILVTQPANAVAGAGGAIWQYGAYRHLLELTVAVPTYLTMTELRPPATPPAGVTITVVSPTVWNVSLALSGGAKTITPVAFPAGSDYVSGARPDSGNTTIVGHTFPTPKSWLLTPVKAGTSTIKLQGLTYSDAPPVDLTLNVTVT